MHETLAMSFTQRIRDIDHPLDRLLVNGRFTLQLCGEVVSDNKLRDDVDGEFRSAPDFVNGNDIGMFQACDGSGFLKINFAILGTLDDLGFRYFDSDFALQLVITTEVNDSESALA